MNTKKVILALFTVIFMISCQKDDEQLQDSEQLESLNASFKRLAAPSCNYIDITVTIYAGEYSGCELIEKILEKKTEMSQRTNSEGCRIFKPLQVRYFNCESMNKPSYVEAWQKIPCTNWWQCPDEKTMDVTLDQDVHKLNTKKGQSKTNSNFD